MQRICQLVLFVAIAAAVGCAQTDPGITTAVKTKLAADDLVKAHQIDVDTRDGVVTLTGAVDTQAAKDRAVVVARGTEGVVRVEDQITVSPVATTGRYGEDVGDRLSDAGITGTVKTRLLADPDVAGLKIDVDTNNTVVTLTGTVATEGQKAEAEKIAKDTTGVSRVVNNLKVGR